ncbi:hypothetical protein DFH28DRAFT_1084294 [Melampsora americana]|nr:hypothetical protein DFH28DRAFT_1084294 [Melampsora americana]
MSDWDDIFGDDMMVEDDDVVNQTPNEPSLSAHVQTGDSPHSGPATLFHPPPQQIAPGSAPSRVAASHASVKKYSDLLKLTKANHEVLQKMYDNTVMGDKYLGTLYYLVFIFQESRVSSGSKWDNFKDQAYSKSVAEDYTTMLQSLEVLTFNYLKGLSAEFLEEHGPVDYVAGEGCVPGTSMHGFIKEVLKNQQSKVRLALLTKILGVAEELKVPAAKTLVLQVRLEDNAALAQLGRVKVKRIIFMQYMTAYYYLNQMENKKRCQWTLMDKALADLCERPKSNCKYFDQVAHLDRDIFNGKRTWATIKASGMPAPFVDQVLAHGQENGVLG